MWHVNQHRAGGWREQGAHCCSQWHSQELYQWQQVNIMSKTDNWVESSPQGGNRSAALYS